MRIDLRTSPRFRTAACRPKRSTDGPASVAGSSLPLMSRPIDRHAPLEEFADSPAGSRFPHHDRAHSRPTCRLRIRIGHASHTLAESNPILPFGVAPADRLDAPRHAPDSGYGVPDQPGGPAHASRSMASTAGLRQYPPIWRGSLPASMVDSGAQIWVICAAARVVGRLNRHRAVAAPYVMRAVVLARLAARCLPSPR